MANDRPSSRERQTPTSRAAPAIALPKGGGALRGIGEKFAANPVTGSGSISVPIAVSPGRSGFGPALSLSYDSGRGNGPFGFGWSLDLPGITRKTDKGLPQYLDAAESDVFVLSGAEDLVPIYRQDPDGTWVAGRAGYQRDPKGNWVRDSAGRLVIHEDEIDGHRVRRYRPRIEGLFARIERWSKLDPPHDIFWLSISKDNILTLYGCDAGSRITDPQDASRIFTWLICETRNDKGNAVLYRYKAEDGTGVVLSESHERNRGPQNDDRRTANRYLKRIYYGNPMPLLSNAGQRPRLLTRTQFDRAEWMFEAVFDYGEHDAVAPRPNDPGAWAYRPDPFSSYRSGFEIRTTRFCRRVLMFHHFPGEPGVERDCLVRSTDFAYSDNVDVRHARNPVYTFLRSVTQTGYRRSNDGYHKRSLPPVEFEYTKPVVQDAIEEVDSASLANLPVGLDGANYQWSDLHGEGISGILTEQSGSWYYKRNLSPISREVVDGVDHLAARFAPVETVNLRPSIGFASGAQLMDLAGDGQPDLVVLEGPMPGFYEHDEAEGWQPFRPFASRLTRDTRDPNLKFVDLDGDGHADVIISEDDTFVWHPSLAEQGFGSAQRAAKTLNEEEGPRIVFADGTQSIYLADMSGDGLTDIVRIRNGEICYWPNLGYGRFGAKVTMDQAPYFDNPDQFDQRRIRLADIDGTGTADVIYLHRNGVRISFNQSGNSWSSPTRLHAFPRIDDTVSITAVDLLGNGTACLVWSSPLPGDSQRQLRYVNLMGRRKPHLLVKTTNNLGTETRVTYAPSTKFYLQDKRDGRPWITRLPFPVHVVERVETYDRISRNRFVTRYAYHHGYFDGEEREFRGFGMVEQWDTEEFDALRGPGAQQSASLSTTNEDPPSHIPPVLTRTWFHTGAYLGRDRISRLFAGLRDRDDLGEYYREPNWLDDEDKGDAEAEQRLLDDTILPDIPDLTLEEEREACRALRGSMLRQEVYALDRRGDGADTIGHPYVVTEQNFTIRCLQRRAGHRHSVFLAHPREAITYHYERNPADPRVTHALTLEVDDFGNVLRSLTVGYGRRNVPDRLPEQSEVHATLTVNRFANRDEAFDWRRIGLPVETRTFEIVKPPTPILCWTWDQAQDLTRVLFPLGHTEPAAEKTIAYEEWDWRRGWGREPEPGGTGHPRLRLIEHVRTIYRRDDLTGLLSLGEVEPLALAGETYKLALTPGLVSRVFRRGNGNGAVEDLLPDRALVLQGRGASDAGYVEMEGSWWNPLGRVFYDAAADASDPALTAAAELTNARAHFFLPHKFVDPFGQATNIEYDSHKLLATRTTDALGNMTTALNDYRVLQPRLVTDPNGNRAEATFDTLGLVAATAVQGKVGETLGDELSGFDIDVSAADLRGFMDDPLGTARRLLGNATTRVVYDLDQFTSSGQPAYAAVLAREQHVHTPNGASTKIQVAFTYSDGFGREIQKKAQAEPGPLIEGGPDVAPRWVASGWTIFNNKGKPVRQYEPFFSKRPSSDAPLYSDHRLEFGVMAGVSPIVFYDPVGRVVATWHPNHTYEKVMFDPWRQETWDVNDTVLIEDPAEDPDIGGYFRELEWWSYTPTWFQQRASGALGLSERVAAEEAARHTGTPAIAHFDALGRPFLTIAKNRFERAGAIVEEDCETRVVLDIDGNQREVTDALGRVVMRYDYDMLGNRIHQASMEAGERWTLNDATGKPVRAWDSRGHTFRTDYDELRRPVRSYLKEGGGPEILIGRTDYGDEPHAALEDDDQVVAANLRGKVLRVYDQAGIVTTPAYDFKGNVLVTRRRLATEYKQNIKWPMEATPGAGNWPATLTFEADTYTTRTFHDALNRLVQQVTPDGSVFVPTYNEANLLEQDRVWLRTTADAMAWREEDAASLAATDASLVIADIDYNAKGQRTLIAYGNGAVTSYDYDPLTFRLTRLTTERPRIADTERLVQNLSYKYDPAGNITHIRDDARQTIYFRNTVVEPSCDYTYDALYRLIEATGREHIGQTGAGQAPWAPHYDPDCAGRIGLTHPHDGTAMRRYAERYDYDAVGNFTKWQRSANGGSWTRHYRYEQPSLIPGEEAKVSNRLSRTSAPGDTEDNPSLRYVHDAHGNMVSMPHLSRMEWDFADRLKASARQHRGDGGAPETTWYVYDASGQRVRKITERASPSGRTPQRKNERVYIGGFEVYREYRGDDADLALERETLSVSDGSQRVALIETKTRDRNATPSGQIASPHPLWRYQFGNQQGSVAIELSDTAQVVSYEEYTPYGSTSYQAGDPNVEVSLKRYRYTGMERDEETGLAYHTARYYAPWLGRWASADPIGIADDLNVFQYAQSRPTGSTDREGKQTEFTEFLPGNLTDYPRLGTLWDQAAENVLERRFGLASSGANRRAFAEALDALPEGHARTEFARSIFNSARSNFYESIARAYDRGDRILGNIPLSEDNIKNMRERNAPRDNLQIHHGEPNRLSTHPENSLDPDTLGLRTGHERVPGSSHHAQRASEVREHDRIAEFERRQALRPDRPSALAGVTRPNITPEAPRTAFAPETPRSVPRPAHGSSDAAATISRAADNFRWLKSAAKIVPALGALISAITYDPNDPWNIGSNRLEEVIHGEMPWGAARDFVRLGVETHQSIDETGSTHGDALRAFQDPNFHRQQISQTNP